MITYTKKNEDRYVFCKDGLFHLALNLKQVNEINKLSTEIIVNSQKGNKLWHRVKLVLMGLLLRN